MKRVLAGFLAASIAIALLPLFASAAVDDSYESIKTRVSEIYQIPMEIVDTLDEERVRSMDVDYSQVVSANEVYVNFVTDENGESTTYYKTEEDYLEYISTPVTMSNSSTVTNSWMRVYIIIIDDGGTTLDISSTYTWLIQPNVLYNQYDMLTISWENGVYIPGSATGFYSYKALGTTHSVNLSGFVNPADSPKSVNYTFLVNDSGARTNEFYHMMVTVQKDYGVNSEHAWAQYSRQIRTVAWSGAIGAGISLAYALYIPNPASGIIAVVSILATIFGDINDSYEVVLADADCVF